jgi:AAA domain/Bifunctional DNA primase/polymerase, N-terminal
VTTTLHDAPPSGNAACGLGPDDLAALDIARDLVRLGVPVFTATLDRDGKPARLGWERIQPDLSEVDNWRPGLALCALMGHKFDALDIDPRHGGQESYGALLGELGQQKPTVYGRVQTPSGGEHLWLAPLGVGSRDRIRDGLDFKGGRPDGSGRGLVFIPPTVRPSKITGELLPYRWAEVPSIVPATADRTGTPLARIVSGALNGHRGNGTALRAGIDLGAVVTGGVPEGEPHDAHLARVTMSLACRGFSKEEAYLVWQTAVSNTKLTREGEPFTRADFERHWRGASAKVAADRQSHTSHTSHTVREDAEGLLAGVRDGAWLSAQDFPALEYAVPGLIPEGLTLLVGPPKAGKSWLTLNLLLAVASGGVALGKIKAGSPRRVFYLALEDGDRRMQGRCRQLLGGRNDVPALFTYQTRLAGAVVPTMRAWMERHSDTGLIVVDTLGKVMPPSGIGESAYQRDYRVGSELKALADEYRGLAVVVLHHDRKATAEDFVDAVSGTHGLAGSADTIAVLARKRQAKEGVLRITGRDVAENEYALTVTSGAMWELDGDDLDEAASKAASRTAEQQLGDRSAELLAMVRQQGRISSAEAVEKFGSSAYEYLRRLVASGRIDKAERGWYVALPAPEGGSSS